MAAIKPILESWADLHKSAGPGDGYRQEYLATVDIANHLSKTSRHGIIFEMRLEFLSEKLHKAELSSSVTAVLFLSTIYYIPST